MTPFPDDPQPESRFTASRRDCPFPDRWSSTDPDSTEIEVTMLVAGFVAALQPDLVVETGTAWGQTAKAIGEALAANGQGELVTYEPNGKRADYSADLCADLPVTVIRQESLVGLAGLREQQVRVGFAWLDSLLDLREQELWGLKPMLSRKAVVGIHDSAIHIPGTIRKLRQQWDIIDLPTPRGVAFLQAK